MRPAPKIHLPILAILITFHFLANFYTIRQSQFLWKDANAWQAAEAKRYCDILRQTKLLKTVNTAMLTGLHPQLYQFTLGAILTFKPPAQIRDFDLPVQLLNTIFLTVMILSIYGIGKLVYGSEHGLLAAVLLSFSPLVFGQLRLPMREVPLAAMVSLFVYLLLKSRHFESLLLSLLAGLTLGLAQLIKETAIIFILPVFLIYSLQALAAKTQKRKRIANCVIALTGAILVTAAVYFNPLNIKMYDNAWRHLFSPDYPYPFLYLSALPRYFLGWPAFLAALPLLAACLRKIRTTNILFAAWLIFPLIVFSFCGFKAVRYMIPAVPALFLILSGSFSSFSRQARVVYPALLVAVFVLQYTWLNFFSKNSPYYPAYSVDEAGLLKVKKDVSLLKSANDLAGYIAATPCARKKYHLFYLNDSIYRPVLRLMLRLKGKESFSSDPKEPESIAAWTRDCSNADFLLEEAGDMPDMQWPFIKPEEYKKYREACMPFFEPAREFPSRNSGRPTIMRIYRRKVRE